MKTLVRIITIFIVLTFIASDCISAQGRGGMAGNITGAPESVPPTPQTGTNVRPQSGTSSPSFVTERSLSESPFNSLNIALPSSFGGRTGTRSDNILVIPTGEIGVEELLTINEYMNVMSRIFENELNRQQWLFSDGQWVSTDFRRIFGGGTDAISSMYLQDYGALFMMQVDFPLSAPPETQEQQEETEKEDVDEVWEQTRQQIYEPRQVPAATTRRAAERPEVVYDAQQVENLKTTLIQSLKHAANIQTLAPDESVIIRIAGSGRSSEIISAVTHSVVNQETQIFVRMSENGRDRTIVMTPEAYQDLKKRFSTPEVLVIRAKKSDIDAFAEGELDFEKFREKVQLLSYPLLGGNAGVGVIGATPVPRAASTVSTINAGR